MKHLKDVHAISEFLLGKEENQMKDAIASVHEEVRKKLGLPDHIRVSGFTLEHISATQNAAGCKYTCTSTDAQGHVHVFCSNTPC